MLFTFRVIQSAFHSKYGQANVKALQNRFKIIFKHYDEVLLLIKLAFPSTSVTRLVDVLEFGQVFKAFGNNYFAQISRILREFFVNESKSIIFLVKSFLGNFFDIWRFFLVTLLSIPTPGTCLNQGQIQPNCIKLQKPFP